MATTRITVSVPAEIATRIKRAAGRACSVSAWVTNAVKRTLEEEESKERFLTFCDGVKATAAEERQAKASFVRVTRGKQRSRGASKAGRGKTAA